MKPKHTAVLDSYAQGMLTITHRETVTKVIDNTIVFNEWLYDGQQIHLAMWFKDHLIKARHIELEIYDEILKPVGSEKFAGTSGKFIIHSENGYWIDGVTRLEKYDSQYLIQEEVKPIEVKSFTLKLDNSAICNFGITRDISDAEGKVLWREDIPLLQYIKEKQDEQSNLQTAPL